MRVVSGKAKGVVLKAPVGMLTRPTADRVKEAMFSIVQFDVPGAAVLDLFGGTGQLGIEALSRGALSAVFVDSREDACRLIKENVKRAGFDKEASVIRSDYMAYLKRCGAKFDIILLDPPYAEEFLENSLKMIAEIDILKTSGIIIAERSVEKAILPELSGFERSKDYKYGTTFVTIFRKVEE